MAAILGKMKDRFPEKFAQTVADALIQGLRSKKPDEPLTS